MWKFMALMGSICLLVATVVFWNSYHIKTPLTKRQSHKKPQVEKRLIHKESTKDNEASQQVKQDQRREQESQLVAQLKENFDEKEATSQLKSVVEAMENSYATELYQSIQKDESRYYVKLNGLRSSSPEVQAVLVQELKQMNTELGEKSLILESLIGEYLLTQNTLQGEK